MSEETLPRGWAPAILGDIAESQSGIGFPPSYQGKAQGSFPFAKVGDIARAVISGTFKLSAAENYVSESDVKALRGKIIPTGSTVFPKIGAAIACERRALVTTACLLDNNCTALIPNKEAIDSNYLFAFMRLIRLSPLSVATTIPSLRKSDVEGIEINLPPLPEQKRIVKKIEGLQSRSKRAREALNKVPDLIEKFRQSVLASAFRGDLTKEWREKNKDKIEPASEILKRIRIERRKKWEEEQLKKFEASGKKPKDDLWKEKYKEPDAADVEGLPELPEGWCWVRIEELCNVVRGGSPRPAGDARFYDGNIPFLKVADLTNTSGLHVKSAKHTIKEAGLSRTRWVNPPTLLLSNSGATLGVPRICNIGATFNDGIAAFLGLEEEDLEYHCYFWLGQTERLRSINQGAAQPNLNTDLIANVMIPFCSCKERQQVVVEIEKVMSTCSEISNSVLESLVKISSLDQSILAKAFRGELVPQDPNDEPASVLLERIRKEREKAAGKKLVGKQKREKTEKVPKEKDRPRKNKLFKSNELVQSSDLPER